MKGAGGVLRPLDAIAFLESTTLVPWEGDAATGRVSYVGEQASAFLGYPLDEWLRADFWDSHVFPDDQATVGAARARLLSKGGSHVIDYRMEHADGRIVWACEVVSLSTDEHGVQTVRGFLMDVTERKRQEVMLWKKEERLRALLRGAPDALVLTDADGIILNMNDHAERLFSYALSEVVGSSIDHFVPERLRARLPELRAAFDRDPERRSLVDVHDFAVIRSDGEEVPVEIGMSVLPGSGDGRQFLCSVRDLTARRRVEAQLRSSERRVREIADVLPAMVCYVDAGQRYRFVNDAYARWHGWARRQMTGRLVREVIGERAYAQVKASIEAVLSGSPGHFRGELENRTGKRVPVDVSLVPQHDDDGSASGYLEVAFDVSDEVAAREADRRHRAELAHVARVATMGELTASIAHELNQPLAAIVANAQAAKHLLDRDPPDVGEAKEAIRDISEDGLRAGEVISGIRRLLHRGEPQPEAVEVLPLIQEVIDLLRSESIARGVEVTSEGSDGGSMSVRADAIQLKQVFLNLLMNAIEATSGTSDPRQVNVVASQKGAEVEVLVIDTGGGLPEGDPEDLFAPFVSHRAEGLGMGLAISRTIVEAHGGKLWAERRTPTGSAFTIRLPAEGPSARPGEHR